MMFDWLFNKKKDLVEGDLYIRVNDVNDYWTKCNIIGLKLNAYDNNSVLNPYGENDRWTSEEKTLARVGYKTTKKARDEALKLDFVDKVYMEIVR